MQGFTVFAIMHEPVAHESQLYCLCGALGEIREWRIEFFNFFCQKKTPKKKTNKKYKNRGVHGVGEKENTN